jgi:hypothetical protein
MTSDESAPDASVVPRSPTGVFLCGEPCGLNNLCRMGILAARMEDDNSVSFDIECPTDYRETPNFAHVSWTAGVMSEMCGQFPLFLGVMAFAATVQPEPVHRAGIDLLQPSQEGSKESENVASSAKLDEVLAVRPRHFANDQAWSRSISLDHGWNGKTVAEPRQAQVLALRPRRGIRTLVSLLHRAARESPSAVRVSLAEATHLAILPDVALGPGVWWWPRAPGLSAVLRQRVLFAPPREDRQNMANHHQTASNIDVDEEDLCK